MNKDQISMRQLMVLLFLGQLSPGIHLISGSLARRAGSAGWLAPLGALLLLLALGWLASRLAGDLPKGQGLANGFRAALGTWGGRLAATLYIMWGFLLLTVELRLYGERMTTLSPGGTGRWFFLLALSAVLAWMASGKLSAFARAGEIFYLAMLLLLAVVAGAGLLQIDGLNLLPVRGRELTGVPAAALEAAALLSQGVYVGFLLPHMLRRPGDGRALRRWTAALCLTLALLQVVVLGGLGADLAARSEVPLFVLTRDMSIGGAVQRLEGLTLSLWVLSDLVLLGVLLFSLCRLLEWLLKLRGRFLPAMLLAAALAVGELGFPEGRSLQKFSAAVLPVGNFWLCICFPALAVLCKTLRRRAAGKDISCGVKMEETKDIVVQKKGEKKMRKR